MSEQILFDWRIDLKSLFEKNNGSYSAYSDYYIPNLTLPNCTNQIVGLWGQRRLSYLKNHKRVQYVNLLTSGMLTDHLCEIDEAVQKLWDNIIKKMAVSQGVTEQLKAENHMLWVGMMNNIRACAAEIVT